MLIFQISLAFRIIWEFAQYSITDYYSRLIGLEKISWLSWSKILPQDSIKLVNKQYNLIKIMPFENNYLDIWNSE